MSIQNSDPAPLADPPKRSFFKWMWGVLGLIAFAETLFLIFSFFLPKTKKQKQQAEERIIPAGAVDNYPLGTVTAFTRGFFYLSRLEDGGFIAVSSKCTHLGCTLPWDEEKKQFICPCHASRFDNKGRVLSAPAPRPLDRLPVRIENRMIFVDIGKKIRRQAFTGKDVVYADQVKTKNKGKQG